MNALARDLMDRLYDEGVSTVYVDALIDVLETHWSVRASTKTHYFWVFRAFIDRIATTAEECSITVGVRPDAWTSQGSMYGDSTTDATRYQDRLT